ncbi:unnamed protein product, partial [Mycena citricolor]
VNPPANAQASDKVRYRNAEEAIDGPAVRNTNVSKVMGNKGQLLPEQTQEECACDEPAVTVGIERDAREQSVPSNLRSVARDIACVVQASVTNTFVKDFVCV